MIALQGAFRRGFDLITSKDQPMGFIHTLYYYQVEKSMEDAKRERKRVREEKTRKKYEALNNKSKAMFDRAYPASRKERIRQQQRNNTKSVNKQQPSYTNDDLKNVTEDDLEEAFDY